MNDARDDASLEAAATRMRAVANDRASFEPECAWQVQELERLSGKG